MSVAEKQYTIDEFVAYVENFRVKKEEGKIHTHRTMRGDADDLKTGNFCIADEHLPTLYDMIHNLSLKRGIRTTLMEVHQDIKPVMIDLDFKFEMPEHRRVERRYTRRDVKQIVECYDSVIRRVFNLSMDSELRAYIMERDEPYINRGKDGREEIKDGIHIIYPEILCDCDAQKIIRAELLEEGTISQILAGLGSKNSVEQIIDESVFGKNKSWYVYGCSKPGRQPYLLTGIHFNDVLREVSVDERTDKDLIRALSLREGKSGRGEIHEASSDYIQKVVPVARRPRPVVSETIRIGGDEEEEDEDETQFMPSAVYVRNMTDEVDEIHQLVEFLSPERACDHTGWMNVGYLLFTLGKQQKLELLPIWIEFSQRASDKSKDRSVARCRDEWRKMRVGNWKIFHLHSWAKLDNIDEYNDYIVQCNRAVIMKCLRDPKNLPVAMAIKALYGTEVRHCGSERKGKWCFFKDHRWKIDEDGYEFQKLIQINFMCEINIIIGKILETNGMRGRRGIIDDDVSNTYVRGYQELTTCLAQQQKLNPLLHTCSAHMHDKDLQRYMDSKLQLIGFENGVYDAESGEFRVGDPEDYISLSTGYDFIPDLTWDTPEVVEVMDFLRRIIPNEDIFDFFLKSVGASFCGYAKNLEFAIFMIGKGSNGKTALCDFISKAFGEYAGKADSEMLTKEKAGGNQPDLELTNLVHARFLHLDEYDDGDQINPKIFKNLIAGGSINTRTIFEGLIKFQPEFLTMISSNKKPILNGSDFGAARRIKMIPFESTFFGAGNPNYNPQNPRHFIKMERTQAEIKFTEWRPYFAWILIQKCREWRAIGQLPTCAQIDETTNNFLRNSDIFGVFVTNHIDTKPGNFLRRADIYRFYTAYAKANGITNKTQMLTQEQFVEQFDQRFGSSCTRKGNVYGWFDFVYVAESEGDDDLNEAGKVSEGLHPNFETPAVPLLNPFTNIAPQTVNFSQTPILTPPKIPDFNQTPQLPIYSQTPVLTPPQMPNFLQTPQLPVVTITPSRASNLVVPNISPPKIPGGVGVATPLRVPTPPFPRIGEIDLTALTPSRSGFDHIQNPFLPGKF